MTEIEAAEQRGYEKAKAEFERANRKPLFEAARDYVIANWREPAAALNEGITAIEREYKAQMIPQDRRLCLAQQRRMRLEAERAERKRTTGSITGYEVVT